MKNNTFEEIWNALKKSKKILMSLHPKPDGDSLGSCTALKYVLEREGKNVTLFSKDDLSENLAELEISKEVKFGVDISEISWEGYDTIVFLDHGTLQYYSQDMSNKLREKLTINMDHHEVSDFVGKISYIDVSAVSTCSILVQFFIKNKIEFDEELSTRLFLGVSTDTGFFSNINAEKAFPDAAFLAKMGGRYFQRIFLPIMGSTSLKVKKMQGVLFDNLEILKMNNKKVGYSFLSKKEIKKLSLDISDLRLGIAFISDLKGVDFVITLFELDGEVKGSLRSSTIDVSKIAQVFGGGGHKLAAGFVIKGVNLIEAKKKIMDVIKNSEIHIVE